MKVIDCVASVCQAFVDECGNAAAFGCAGCASCCTCFGDDSVVFKDEGIRRWSVKACFL